MVPGGYQNPIPGLAGSPRDRALDRQEGLIDEAGALAVQRAQAAGQAADMQREAVDEAEARRVELENDRRAAMGAARDRYRRAVERVSAMQVDPARMFRQPGDVVGAAIGIALGAAASAVSGDQSHQENALALIQQHIDRDIEAQRANIANAQAGLAGEESILAMTSQEFESREAAEQAARSAMLEGVAARIARMEADLGVGEARTQAEQMRFDVQQQAAAAAAAAQVAEEDRMMERALQLAQLRRRNAQAAREERRAMGGGGGAGHVLTPQQMDAWNRQVDSGADPMALAQAYRIDPRTIPASGRFSEATSGEQAGTVATLSTQLDRLEGMLPGEGEDIPGVGRIAGHLPDIAVSTEGEALRQQLETTIEIMGRLHSGGAISDDEFVRFRRILGAAPGQSDDALRRGIASIRAEIGARRDRRTEGRTRDERVDRGLSSVGAQRVE
jgi:hypothetical protein